MPAELHSEGGQTSDTHLLDMISLHAFEISVGRQRILFLTHVRYQYYNHVNALTILTNTAEHFAFLLISCVFLFCTALTISHVVYNLIVAWKSAAISIILCAAYKLSATFMEMKIIQSITRNPRSFLICLSAASVCTSTTYTPWFNFLKANVQSTGLMRQFQVHGGIHKVTISGSAAVLQSYMSGGENSPRQSCSSILTVWKGFCVSATSSAELVAAS